MPSSLLRDEYRGRHGCCSCWLVKRASTFTWLRPGGILSSSKSFCPHRGQSASYSQHGMTGRVSPSTVCTRAGSLCKLNSARCCVRFRPKSFLGVRGDAMLARHANVLIAVLYATHNQGCNIKTAMQMWNGWKLLLQPKMSACQGFCTLMQCFLKQQVHFSQ